MTERLYYADSYLRKFDATIVEAGDIGGRPYVVLDRSAFYPSSGGQPFDTGVLGGRRVIDVIDREDDGAVMHVLDGPLTRGPEAPPPHGSAEAPPPHGNAEAPPPHGNAEAPPSHGSAEAPPPETLVAAGLQPRVTGYIDWSRRFDHMQHHTGQHVLSAAFLRTSNLPTVSFHLGTDVCTIDLAGVADADAVTRSEDEANQVVWENRPVTVRFVSEEEAARLPLRKAPVRGGTLRIVEVEGFDLSACGGTHVPRTGVIGAIAVQAWEKYKGGTRVSFLCGGRVVARFRDYRDVVAGAVRQLSIQPGELPAAIARLQADSRDRRQQITALGDALAVHEADQLARAAQATGGSLVVCRVIEGKDVNGLKSLAQAVASRPRHVAVLISRSRPAQVVVARAPDAGVDAAELVKALIGRFGGRGGGKPDAAQGGGLDGDPDAIREIAAGMLFV